MFFLFAEAVISTSQKQFSHKEFLGLLFTTCLIIISTILIIRVVNWMFPSIEVVYINNPQPSNIAGEPIPSGFKNGDKVKINQSFQRHKRITTGTVASFHNGYVGVVRSCYKKKVAYFAPADLEVLDPVAANIYSDWLEEHGFTDAANALRKEFDFRQ